MTIYFTYAIDPDIYYDIEGLTGTVSMGMPIGISNGEDVTLWFKAELINPPSGYTSYSQNLGSLISGASGWFIFTFIRTLPTLTDGELDENLLIRITAYYDSDYSNPYGYANSATTTHFFSSLDTAWTKIDTDTFDDGSVEGWASEEGQIDPLANCYCYYCVVNALHFLSAPYALASGSSAGSFYFKKSFTIGPSYSKARIVLHVWCTNAANLILKIGDQLYIPNVIGALLPHQKWLRITFSLPVNATTTIKMGGSASAKGLWYDEIRVIAK